MAVTNSSLAISNTSSTPAAATTTPTYAAPFLQPLAGQLANYTAGLLTTPTNICGMLPQVAQQNVLQQGAQQAAATQGGLGALQYNAQGQLVGAGTCGTGIAGYQPYLNQASALASSTGYQQFMSPYQQQVINPTLQQYDIQSQINEQALPAAAIQAGAYGGARCGVEQGVYQSQSDLNRALLQSNLEQQGYTQALGQANVVQGEQAALANQQPSLAANTINLLSSAGAGQQAYSQNILNAMTSGNTIANQYPLTQLSGIANLYSTIANATPGTPGYPLLQNPASVAANTLGSVVTGTGGTGALGAFSSSLGSAISSIGSGIGSLLGYGSTPTPLTYDQAMALNPNYGTGNVLDPNSYGNG
jgi:hypothetical protein